MEWRNVVGYEGLYWVNEWGQVKNKKDLIMKHWCNGKKYRYLTLMKNGERRNSYIHRLVGLAFLPIDPHRPDINHKDGDKANNFVENLEWCNKFENMRHAYDNKLLYNPAAKLSQLEVDILRKMWSVGIHRDQIKQVFNVSYGQICRIVNYQNWNGKP